MKWILNFYILTSLLGLTINQVQAERKALLIANTHYQNEGKLRNPPRDIERMDQELSKLGFKVTQLRDLTIRTFPEKIADYVETLQPEDEVYFHYSGHGIEINGETLLLGVDFNARTKKGAYKDGYLVASVIELLSAVKVSIVVIDACRVNPFARRMFKSVSTSRGLPSAQSMNVTLPENSTSGSYLVFSTSQGNPAEDGDQLSPFVQAFIEAIKDHGHEPVATFFGSRVQRQLKRHNQQLEVRLLGELPPRTSLKMLSDDCPRACQPLCSTVCISQIEELENFKRNSSTPSPSSTSLTCGEQCPKIDWKWIKGGSFLMGSGREDETPIRKVTLKGFWISKTEITTTQYRACVNAGICSVPDHKEGCNWNELKRENHPINCVSWFQLQEFAQWIGGQLPTEAQWEFVARSRGKDLKYVWGNIEPNCDYAIIDENVDEEKAGCGLESTSSVCSKVKGNTQQDVCDMTGNVWEWTLDEYYPIYFKYLTHGEPFCIEVEDCKLNQTTYPRSIRGGSWSTPKQFLDTRNRAYQNPSESSLYIGGRVVRIVTSVDDIH